MIEEILESNENIIYREKPSHFFYAIGNIFLYVVAIAWGMFDYNFIRLFMSDSSGGDWGFGGPILYGIPLFLVLFFLLHLTPVWIAIFGFLYRLLAWYKVEYIITNKRVYFISGITGNKIKSITYQDIKNLAVKSGVLEKLFQRGTISFSIEESGIMSNFWFVKGDRFLAIKAPYKVYKILKELDGSKMSI